jgi:hypothetical protein
MLLLKPYYDGISFFCLWGQYGWDTAEQKGHPAAIDVFVTFFRKGQTKYVALLVVVLVN